MIDSALLTLTTSVLLPLVALATILLTPFTNRPTQALLGTYYGAYLFTVLSL